MKEKMYDVGQIVNTHGIKGEVKTRRFTDHEERFHVGKILYAVFPDGRVEELQVKSHRTHQKFELLSFTGYETLNDVKSLKGIPLKIKDAQLKELQADEYYVHDILQCTMYTCEGEKLGMIIDVLATGANDVWVVALENGKEALIPYIRQVVKKVDLTEKKVYIQLMEGLLD